jgi:hypothetical protein|tara:strand:+ start:1451 stop:2746 length:1296 start_codon:yes stop_codon:yes gene_type:complete
MALRLRRGTDAQRQLITPLEGELIFATDTKLLYAGDGTTAGGVAVTGAGGGGVTTLQLLTDTDIGTPEDNQVLTYNSGTSKWVAANNSGAGSLGLNDLSNVFIGGDLYPGDILMADGAGNFQPQSFADFFDEQQNYKINIVGDDSTIILNTDNNALNGSTITATTGFVGNVTGDITGNSTGTHTGPVVGDVSGSIFGDDSSILVDGVNSRINIDNGSIYAVDGVLRNRNDFNINIGAIGDAEATGLKVTVVDNSPPIDMIGLAQGGFGGAFKMAFTGYHGALDTPTQGAAGDYLGGIQARSLDGSTGNLVPSSVVTFQIDPASTVATDTAKGMIRLINNNGTASAPVLVATSIASNGDMAIANTVGYSPLATLDVNGFAKLAVLTAEPTTPAEGMIAIADGSTWDPSGAAPTKKQTVVYLGSAWVQIAIEA